MNFSVNQNRQLYVVNQVVTTTPTLVGDLKVGSLEEGDKTKLYFEYMGMGGLIRSDLIDVSNICYAKATKGSDLRTYLKTALISLDENVNEGKPIVGQDYIVRILIHNYLAPGDSNITVKHGAVHAVAGMSASVFYKKLAKSLELNFSREVTPLFTFEATDDGVVVTEVPQPYVVGFMAQEPVNFDIIPSTVKYQGDDVLWATRDEDTDKVVIEESDQYLNNGPKIADLEYFCMGERGDQNRDWVAAPKRFPVKYLVDPTKSYDVLDMHYFFSDTGVNVQKSEKDITFVSNSDSAIATLMSKLDSFVSVQYSPGYIVA